MKFPQPEVLQVAEAAEEALKAQEAAKDRLCQELNLLVQQSANAQLQRLEELTQKIEVLNRGFLSTSQSSGAAVQTSPGIVAGPASPSQAPKAQSQAESPEQAAHSSPPTKAGVGDTQGKLILATTSLRKQVDLMGHLCQILALYLEILGMAMCSHLLGWSSSVVIEGGSCSSIRSMAFQGTSGLQVSPYFLSSMLSSC